MKKEYGTPKGQEEGGIYRTGSTQPPDSHRGIIAFLLIATIFLGGLSSWLSMMNIRFFSGVVTHTETIPEIADIHSAPPADAQETSGHTLSLSLTAPGDLTGEETLTPWELRIQSLGYVLPVRAVRDGLPAAASAVVLSADGYLITSGQTVTGAESITVTAGGELLQAEVIGTDALTDLALLRVKANDLIPAEFARSDTLKAGTPVAAVYCGKSSGVSNEIAQYTLPSVSRDLSFGSRWMDAMGTEIAVKGEIAGSAVLNHYGQVVGICADTLFSGGTVVSSETVVAVALALAERGAVAGTPTLGITGQGVPMIHQIFQDLPSGVYVTRAEESTVRAGVCAGDVIVALQGEPVAGLADYYQILYTRQPGDTVSATLYRDGEEQTVTLTVEEME